MDMNQLADQVSNLADFVWNGMDMNQLADQVSNLADFVWNGLLLYLLVGTGIIFTIRTRFIQVRKFGTGFKRLFGSINLNGEKAGKEGMSSFQAVATSIAAPPRWAPAISPAAPPP